jgi:hypothetical protein
MNKYEEAIDKLARGPSTCGRCGCARVGTMIGLEFNSSITQHPIYYGCPQCEVAVLESADVAATMWSAVLRHPSDPHWEWLPVNVRAACARAGYGAVKESPVFPDKRLGVVLGQVWAMEGTWGAINTFAHPGTLATFEARLDSASASGKYRIPAGMEPAVQAAMLTPRAEKGGFHTSSRQHMNVGPSVLPVRLMRLVEELNPFAVWHTAGAEQPVVAVRDGRAVALLMGCRAAGKGG